MSVLVTTLLVGCGVLVGRLIARSPRVKRHEDVEVEPVKVPADKAASVDAAPRFDELPCQLGDVVLRSGGDEAWLAGALVMREGNDTVAALFVAPEAGADRVVLARPKVKELAWLSPENGVTVIAGEPPTALEVAGERYERRRRLPLRVQRVGTGAPDIGSEVIFAEYTGLGDQCLVVLIAKDRVLAFRGEILGSGTYDVLPGPDRASSASE